ncbi:N-acetylmuramoyl-L-alanine amidase [Marinilactibacillus psychrotolerans]|uniref:N-acetylmuramoyl-L-alanine amidase n=1 Tax=Marinilactibacillus psychrotolerans TaxID=191770 RepID=UPI0037F9AD5B
MKQIRKKLFAVVMSLSLLTSYASPLVAYASNTDDSTEKQSDVQSEVIENTQDLEEVTQESVSDNSDTEQAEINFGKIISEVESSEKAVITEKEYDIYIDLENTNQDNIIDKSDKYNNKEIIITKQAETENGEFVYFTINKEDIGWVDLRAINILSSDEDNAPTEEKTDSENDTDKETVSTIDEAESAKSETEETTDVESEIIEKEAIEIDSRVMTRSSINPDIEFRTHIQTKGWLPWIGNNEISGTIGEALRVEGFQIKTNFNNLGIQFQSQSENGGWTNWLSGDQVGGTTNQKRQLEGVRFQLTGTEAANYDIYYRVHTQKFGWLPWTKNGEKAGTQGYDYRIEAMQVTILKKGDTSIKTSPEAYRELSTPEITYRSHVQSEGWLPWVGNKHNSGTIGKSLRMEAFQLKTDHDSVGVQYQTRSENGNWTNWLSDGRTGGTINQKRQLEGVRFELTGPQASKFDIYYRVHSKSFGWLPWAKNGEKAGTEGFNYRIESMQITVLPKGDNSISSSGEPYKVPTVPIVKYQSHVQSKGWQSKVGNGETSGTIGKALRLEGVKIDLNDYPLSGNIEYRTHVQTYGWSSFSSNGKLSGTVGESKRLEGIEVRLTGELSNKFDVYYRTHIESKGWLGWVRNGMSAGSENKALRMEALEIKLVEKGKGEVVNENAGFLSDPLIYIDPGHGGKYSGAYYAGVAEKTINLQTSKKLNALLKSKGYRTIMSRTNDRHFSSSLSPDLHHRSQEANKANADIFISLHHNAHPTSTQTGIETYIYNLRGSTSNPLANSASRISNSSVLASRIQSNLISKTGAKNRGVKSANFHVIRETRMPAILLELGFMDNKNDLRKITNNNYQNKLAEAIVLGIDSYFGRR